MSKRIMITLPDSIYADLASLAGLQGRPKANLAAFLIESGISDAKKQGDFNRIEARKANGDT